MAMLMIEVTIAYLFTMPIELIREDVHDIAYWIGIR